MKTIIALAVVLTAFLMVAGCATRGEAVLDHANPDAYEATRGGTTDGTSGTAFDSE